MAEKIKLVQGDTGPQLQLSLADQDGNEVDLSDAGTSVSFKLRASGAAAIKETIVCTKLTGKLLEDGTIDTSAPYNVAGRGGRCGVDWTETALDTAGEFEGEIEITFNDGTVQTVFDPLKLKVRSQFS